MPKYCTKEDIEHLFGTKKPEKYSVEWKYQQKAWVQEHLEENTYGDLEKCYKIHYIKNDTEYTKDKYYLKKEANQELRNFKKNFLNQEV